VSPETNVKDTATATTTTSSTTAAPKAAPAPKKRSETENVIEGHADSLKLDHGFPIEKRRKDGRLVGFVGFGLCAAFLAIIFYRHGNHFQDFLAAYHARTWPVRFWTVLGAIFAFAIVAPVPFHKVWMDYVAAAMGFVMTRVLLTVMFVVGFTPYALLLKLVGSDPLERGHKTGSYWVPRAKRDPKHFEKLS
jgi:hypothetical protein